jgi:hypothetical protein
VDTSKFTFLVSNSTLTNDLTVVSINTHSGEVNGLQQQRESGQIRNISPKNNSSNPTLQLRKASLSSSEQRSFECASEHGGDHHRHEDHSYDGTERRKVTEENSKHSGFQIDLIIDIDRELIKRNRSIEKAVEFVNFIVTTTNVILEKEFDLHLNVVEISETTIFDSNGLGSTKEAIKLYRQTFKDTIGSDKAHLRHALLGRDLGGGIAFSGRYPYNVKVMILYHDAVGLTNIMSFLSCLHRQCLRPCLGLWYQQWIKGQNQQHRYV